MKKEKIGVIDWIGIMVASFSSTIGGLVIGYFTIKDLDSVMGVFAGVLIVFGMLFLNRFIWWDSRIMYKTLKRRKSDEKT